MTCSPCSSLLLLVLLNLAQAQQKTAEKLRAPTKPKTPTVNCSEAQTSKACRSFKQLLEAHDNDILDTLSSPTSYVCFRPSEDAFLIFRVRAPYRDLWKQPDDHVGETQPSSETLTEYRDGVLYNVVAGLGYWWRSSPDGEPEFTLQNSRIEGLMLAIFPTEISIDYPFKKQNGGTTHYSLTIRRSTGRFIETFAGENTPITTHSGTCLIYR